MIELEGKIYRLLAAEDIQHLKVRYANVCDTDYKPEGMQPLFTKDAIWDSGRSGCYEGVDAICGFFAGVSKCQSLSAVGPASVYGAAA